MQVTVFHKVHKTHWLNSLCTPSKRLNTSLTTTGFSLINFGNAATTSFCINPNMYENRTYIKQIYTHPQGGNVTFAGWQVTLRVPMWHVSSCSGVATLRTAIHLLLPYLFTPGSRKVKPTWILLKQETVSGSGISWAICKSVPCSRQTTTPAPHHSVFYRLDALPAAQPTASKHWRYTTENTTNEYNRPIIHVIPSWMQFTVAHQWTVLVHVCTGSRETNWPLRGRWELESGTARQTHASDKGPGHGRPAPATAQLQTQQWTLEELENWMVSWPENAHTHTWMDRLKT